MFVTVIGTQDVMMTFDNRFNSLLMTWPDHHIFFLDEFSNYVWQANIQLFLMSFMEFKDYCLPLMYGIYFQRNNNCKLPFEILDDCESAKSIQLFLMTFTEESNITVFFSIGLLYQNNNILNSHRSCEMTTSSASTTLIPWPMSWVNQLPETAKPCVLFCWWPRLGRFSVK